MLGDFLNFVFRDCSEQVEKVVEWCMLEGIFLLALIILWCHRKQIKQYLCENKTVKKRYLYAFTTVGIILFIGIHFLLALSMLEEI